MKELIVKTVLPVLITFLTTLVTTCGNYSYRLDYVKGENEKEKGRLIMTMMKEVCPPETRHAETSPEP